MKPKHPEQEPLTPEGLNSFGKIVFKQLSGNRKLGGTQYNAALATAYVAGDQATTLWANGDKLEDVVGETYRIACAADRAHIKELTPLVRAYIQHRMHGGERALIKFRKMKFGDDKNKPITGEKLMATALPTKIEPFPEAPSESVYDKKWVTKAVKNRAKPTLPSEDENVPSKPEEQPAGENPLETPDVISFTQQAKKRHKGPPGHSGGAG